MADSDQPVAPASAPTAATLGQMLRNARVAQELTLEQVSTELRIEAKQLKALEENRFDLIGVPVFVKGYLKQYGQRLGLDVPELLLQYYQQTKLADVQIQPSRTIKLRDERQITTWIVAAIVLLTLIVAFAVWWWNGGTFDPARLSPRSSTSLIETTPSADVPQPQQGAVLGATAPESAPAVAPTVPSEVSSAVPDPESAAAVEADTGRAAPAVTIPLELIFEQESWSEVTDARGERLLFGLSAAGRRARVRGEPPFAIVLGNADVVRLLVDGEPYPIPTAGREGNLARFAVDIAEE